MYMVTASEHNIRLSVSVTYHWNYENERHVVCLRLSSETSLF